MNYEVTVMVPPWVGMNYEVTVMVPPSVSGLLLVLFILDTVLYTHVCIPAAAAIQQWQPVIQQLYQLLAASLLSILYTKSSIQWPRLTEPVCLIDFRCAS